MRTDSHIHLFAKGYFEPPIPERDLVAYEAMRTAAGVSTALVVGYEGEERFAGNNDYILALSRHLPWVRPLAFLSVASPPTPAELEHLSSAGYDGFSMYLPVAGPSLDSWPVDLVTKVVELFRGRILSINGSPRAASRVLPQLRYLADNSQILISHLGGAGAAALGASVNHAKHLLAPYLSLSEIPTVMVKVSGLYAMDRPYPHTGAQGVVEAVIDQFGTGRLVWGSDFSPALAAVDRSQLM